MEANILKMVASISYRNNIFIGGTRAQIYFATSLYKTSIF